MLVLRKIYHTLTKEEFEVFDNIGTVTSIKELSFNIYDTSKNIMYEGTSAQYWGSQFRHILGVFYEGNYLVPFDDKAWKLLDYINKPVMGTHHVISSNYAERRGTHRVYLYGNAVYLKYDVYAYGDKRYVYILVPIDFKIVDEDGLYWSMQRFFDKYTHYVNIYWFYNLLVELSIDIDANTKFFVYTKSRVYYKFDINKDVVRYITKLKVLG